MPDTTRKKPGFVKRLTLFTAALLALGAAATASAQAADKPNILVIWGDDIGGFNISAYNRGMMGYKTPNIDRSPSRARCSPTGMASRAAPPAAPPS